MRWVILGYVYGDMVRDRGCVLMTCDLVEDTRSGIYTNNI